jgi:uncharacterized protein (DUF2267 family)
VLEQLRTDTIDHAADGAQLWLHAIAEQLDCRDLRTAYHALRAVLHVVRDRLPLPDIVALGAQLPVLIRGIYYEGWAPHAMPTRACHVEEFLGLIERTMADAGIKLEPQHVVDAVFNQLRVQLSPSDLERLVPSMPAGMRLLFTAPAHRPSWPSTPATPSVAANL